VYRRLLAESPEAPSDRLYQLARACAKATGSARSAPDVAAGERSALAERYAVQVVIILRKLKARAYFKDASRLEDLKRARDLQSLHGRADYAQLVAETKESR
jgi:hypothetical protein